MSEITVACRTDAAAIPTITSLRHFQTARGAIWWVMLDSGHRVAVTTATLFNFSQFRAAARRQAGVELPHVVASVWRTRIADHVAAARRRA